MTDEPQVALTTPPITHVWATTYESEFERKQRKVTCLRAEQGLAITECGHEVYTFTHIASGKRFTNDLTDKQALSAERTDSDRYAELRALVEAWQSHQAGSSTALAEWRHR